MNIDRQYVRADKPKAQAMEFHPLATAFPLIEGEEFDALTADIKANGLREVIMLFEGKILDGRNRYLACQAAGVVCRYGKYSGNDPVAFVVSVNLRRRHLNESQRAMIAARLANLRRGDVASQLADPSKQNDDGEISPPQLSAGKAAALLNVDRSTVTYAKAVLREGTAEEIEAVERGAASVSTIARKIGKSVPPEKRAQKQTLSKTGKNPDRIEAMRANAKLWSLLRDALQNLTSLPHPADVVRIVLACDKAKLTDAKLSKAIEWLTEFSDAWTNHSDAKADSRREDQPSGKAEESAAA